MVSFRIALRFRDFLGGPVQSIAAHNMVFSQFGNCYWGWWRKQSEPSRDDVLSDLEHSGPFNALLLNSTDRSAWIASCRSVKRSFSQVNPQFIPEYYREQFREIAAFFELAAPIAAVSSGDFDEAAFDRLGEATLYLPEELVPVTSAPAPALTTAAPSVAVLISDMHYGSDHAFVFREQPQVGSEARTTLRNAIAADVRAAAVDVGSLIFAGDLTTKANWESDHQEAVATELRGIIDDLKVDKAAVFLSPGNHDFDRPTTPQETIKLATRYRHETEFRLLRELVTGHPVTDPLSYTTEVDCGKFIIRIGVLNSSTLAKTVFSEYGYVGDHGDDVFRAMAAPSSKPAFRVLVLHHHLIPINYIERPRESGISLTLDAADLLEKAQRVGVQLILHGHQHKPTVLKHAQLRYSKNAHCGLTDEDIYVVASGSAGSTELPADVPNTYTILRFGVDNVVVSARAISRTGTQLPEHFVVTLPVVPR
jgi:calcineurin-like phosphoesterase family protein